MRTRVIKPDFFKDEDLIALPFEWRLLFAGLWLMADREGILEDKPLKIKYEIFPGDEIDVEQGLKILAQPKIINPGYEPFIIRYAIAGRQYVQIPNFKKHQYLHHLEKSSSYPPCANLSSNYGTCREKVVIAHNKNKNKNKNLKKKDKEGSTDSDFALFWKEYPNKKNKQFALKTWEKQKPPISIVLATLEKAKNSREWLEDGGKFIPHPATWLNAGGWENEYDVGEENVTRIPIKAEPRADEQITKLPIPPAGENEA